MSEYRSAAEQFVTEFLDYVEKYDIKDELNKRKNIMERSPGVEALIKKAQAIFPPRVDVGKVETDKLTEAQVDEAIATSPNVIDTRARFAKRVAANGGTHALLRQLYADEPGAREAVEAFLNAEDGKMEFASE